MNDGWNSPSVHISESGKEKRREGDGVRSG
jgi:hypothetical protein